MSVSRPIPAVLLVLSLAGCAPPPEIEAALGPEPEGTGYPELLPLSEILAEAPAETDDPEAADAAMAARVAALKARAAALKRSGSS